MIQAIKSLNVETLGQVFTPDEIVSLMIGLLENSGRTLEPSSGDGAFSKRLDGCVSIEIDPTVASRGAIVGDFFAYPKTEKFDSIIGNPPYVRFQDIAPSTKSLLKMDLFDGRTNLYLFFIDKAISHLREKGELVFIVPRDMIKLTAARKLNKLIFSLGTITHWIETGDQKIFNGAVPNCAIFRFELGNKTRKTKFKCLGETVWHERVFTEMEGQIAFLEKGMSVPLSSLFYVKVGAVSGADPLFSHPEGNVEFVCSKTVETGETRRMLYNVRHPALEGHKERLLQRRIRAFTDNNWWAWGRAYHDSESPRIYVNGKTRKPQPFFTHECRAYDGSVLALFPKNPKMNLEAAIDLFNRRVPWDQLGFVVDGRFIFSQRSLQTVVLPDEFRDLFESNSQKIEICKG